MNTKQISFLVSFLLIGFFQAESFCQPLKSLVQVLVTPENEDWLYEPGERADFFVQVLKNGQLVKNASIKYTIGPEKMPPEQEGELTLKSGHGKIQGMNYSKPGFIRCKVSFDFDMTTYTGAGTAGYSPEKIQPIVKLPTDFIQFWDSAKAELAEIPIDAKLTLIPEQCGAGFNVYHLNLQNIKCSWKGNSRFYGMLSVPTAPGKYPAILRVPGAGVRPYNGDKSTVNGVIILSVGIHGIPVNMDKEVYEELGKGALGSYHMNRLDDLNNYYYKRVYLGCIRAIDYIYSMPEFDGKNLAVAGGSQGGALSIVTAGLDKRITCLAAFYPALCDLVGYTAGRAGGWPHMFSKYNAKENPQWAKVAPYYDVVNFARQLTQPGFYCWGYNDNVCPPTSMYAAYNSIQAKKELHIYLETSHWTYPEQWMKATEWMYNQIGVKVK